MINEKAQDLAFKIFFKALPYFVQLIKSFRCRPNSFNKNSWAPNVTKKKPALRLLARKKTNGLNFSVSLPAEEGFHVFIINLAFL